MIHSTVGARVRKGLVSVMDKHLPPREITLPQSPIFLNEFNLKLVPPIGTFQNFLMNLSLTLPGLA